MYIAGKASKNHYKQVEVVSWWADQASCFDYDYYYLAHPPSGLFSDQLHQVLRLLILPTKLRLFYYFIYNNCDIHVSLATLV
jgi:hypothetical protein